MPRRLHLRRPVLGVLLATSLLLTACGDDDAEDVAVEDAIATGDDAGSSDGDAATEGDETGDEATATGPGACELLSEEQVSSAFGTITDVVHEEGSAASLEMCEWRLEGDGEGMGLPPTLQLVLLGPDDYESRTQGAEGLYEPVPDLGDEALWAFAGSEQTGYTAQLLVLEGDRGIHLNAAGVDLAGEDQARETFVSFAEDALAAG